MPSNVAYMEEVDDDCGSVIDGVNRTYAASTVAPSPTKERMNISKKKKSKRESTSPVNIQTDSDSTVHPVAMSRRESRSKSSREKERERERAPSKKVTYAARPQAPPHSRTTPVVSSRRRSRDESSYYGVEPATVTSASSRPRAQTTAPRPASYYGGSSRPPLSNQRFQGLHTPAPVPSPMPTSYPPQAWAAAGPVSYPMAPPPYPTLPQSDYFQPRPPLQHQLAARFNRPSTAMGHRAPSSTYDDGYDVVGDRVALSRRSSLRRDARDDEDRRRMPPPARPSSARPLSIRPSPFAPPPQRRSSGYLEEDDLAIDASPYQDVSPMMSSPYEYTVARAPRTRRPSVGAPSVTYDTGPYSTEVARSGSRRNSYYNSSSSGYEDKIRQASTYQEEVNGGPTMPLTAETLRKASKTSSRSTRSSASHDESDWRQSNTTRTSQSNDEDITIRVKGTAVLKVGGAEMQCQDGAEININSGRQGTTVRGGSDRSSYMDPDERQMRFNRPQIRNRATSQSGSHSRTTAPYGYPYAPAYDYTGRYAPPPPPAPGANWL